MPQKTLTFALMDAPYESANLTTAFRIFDAAARRGHNINVFGDWRVNASAAAPSGG